MRNQRETTGRTLGDLSVNELLESARHETMSLGRKLTELGVDDLTVRAYIGSIAARIAVAESKLEEER